MFMKDTVGGTCSAANGGIMLCLTAKIEVADYSMAKSVGFSVNGIASSYKTEGSKAQLAKEMRESYINCMLESSTSKTGKEKRIYCEKEKIIKKIKENELTHFERVAEQVEIAANEYMAYCIYEVIGRTSSVRESDGKKMSKMKGNYADKCFENHYKITYGTALPNKAKNRKTRNSKTAALSILQEHLSQCDNTDSNCREGDTEDIVKRIFAGENFSKERVSSLIEEATSQAIAQEREGCFGNANGDPAKIHTCQEKYAFIDR